MKEIEGGGRGRGEDQLEGERERERERLIGVERGGFSGIGGLLGGLLGRNKDGSRDIRDGREVKDFEKINKKI